MTQIVIQPAVREKLHYFSMLFLKWNTSINLSAARTPADLDEHITDCLHFAQRLTGLGRVLDVGSGGGLPVVVAAIVQPETAFTAIEPVHKKHAFLRAAIRELELPNLEALALRVEAHAIRDYDAASSRATFDLRAWLALGLQYVRPGGAVFGFEGIPRDDLPPDIERIPYQLRGKTRAIVSLRRPA
jgi:16S rRNA (guanine527-N7)-methyltransferase